MPVFGSYVYDCTSTQEFNKGDKGPSGAQGPKGSKGDVGSHGAVGVNGDKGSKGLKGDKGNIGQKGEKGDKGLGAGLRCVRQCGSWSGGETQATKSLLGEVRDFLQPLTQSFNGDSALYSSKDFPNLNLRSDSSAIELRYYREPMKTPPVSPKDSDYADFRFIFTNSDDDFPAGYFSVCVGSKSRNLWASLVLTSGNNGQNMVLQSNTPPPPGCKIKYSDNTSVSYPFYPFVFYPGYAPVDGAGTFPPGLPVLFDDCVQSHGMVPRGASLNYANLSLHTWLLQSFAQVPLLFDDC